jgi:hypothetical protein
LGGSQIHICTFVKFKLVETLQYEGVLIQGSINASKEIGNGEECAMRYYHYKHITGTIVVCMDQQTGNDTKGKPIVLFH